MKKLLIILFVGCLLMSCHSHINEYAIVKSISTATDYGYKYRVELDFIVFNQYLYTNENFNVGDTLYFKK